MTYNIRLDVQSDGENAWPNRRDFLANQILFHQPHIIGTQEGTPSQIDWLDKNLIPYGRIGAGRLGGHNGEYSAIFYRRSLLKNVNSGTFWLSTTPNTVSVGWDAALPRIVTWGHFIDRRSEEEFFVFNTHFDHEGKQARLESADLIMTMIDSLNPQNLPFLVTGDFNLTPDSDPIKKLSSTLQDAHEVSPVKLGRSGTFNGFNYEQVANRRIDYIFASPSVCVSNFATLTDAIEKKYPSDHFALLSTVNLSPDPLIIAHRGASGYGLENSLDAFRRAVELKADIIELDVFTLKDGEVVCFHDKNLDRLTDVSGAIDDYTLADLNQVTLLDGSRIPTLSQVLELVDKQLRINIELKGPNTAAPVYDILMKHIEERGWKINDFHISSFRHDELQTIRDLDAEIEIGILPHGQLEKAMEVGKKLKAYSINAHHGSLNEESVAKLRDAGFEIYAWTVNDYADIQKLLDLGIDGFITNYPDRVRELSKQ